MPFRHRVKRCKIDSARRMRLYPTTAERVLWEHLRLRPMGIKFRRQEPILGWIIDFYSTKRRLAIEIDGGYHRNPEQQHADERRDCVLREHGIRTIRFTNEQVSSDPLRVLAAILQYPEETPAGRRAASAPRAVQTRDRAPAEVMKSRKGWGVVGETNWGTRSDPARTRTELSSASEAPTMRRVRGQSES